ncbi:MAG TPA: thioredoxin [Bdellovibrionota bacterium]|nr:thioredoxin [Bdellovibrionota bacterium]
MAKDGTVQAVTDQSFQTDVLNSDKPTLVDFWAEWCAPCRAIAPLVEELSNQYGEQVNFRKLNIDDNPSTPMQYGIRGIPTLILFKNGEVVDQVVGAVPRPQLETLVKKGL